MEGLTTIEQTLLTALSQSISANYRMPNNKGYILLFRSILETSALNQEPDNQLSAWIKVLLKVNHSPATVKIKDKTIELKAGQSVRSFENWGKLFKWNSRMKVKRFFEKLEKNEMISIETIPGYSTIITVVNWYKYQQLNSNHLTNNLDVTQNVTQNVTQKPLKNQAVTSEDVTQNVTQNVTKEIMILINNDINYLIKLISDDLELVNKIKKQPTKQQWLKLIDEYGKDDIEDILLNLEDYLIRNPNKSYSNLNLVIRKWIKNKKKQDKQDAESSIVVDIPGHYQVHI